MRGEAVLRLCGLLLVSAGLTACASARAATPVERPALEVPPIPPRIIEPAPAPESEPIEPVGEVLPPPVNVPAATKPRPNPAREAKEAKTESKPEVPAPPPDPAASVPPVAPPPPVLRTPATANVAAVQKEIRDTLARAQGMLNTVDYKRLSPERRKAYGEAQDFITSTEAAIKVSNFESAKELAEKAEKLARELQGR